MPALGRAQVPAMEGEAAKMAAVKESELQMAKSVPANGRIRLHFMKFTQLECGIFARINYRQKTRDREGGLNFGCYNYPGSLEFGVNSQNLVIFLA